MGLSWESCIRHWKAYVDILLLEVASVNCDEYGVPPLLIVHSLLGVSEVKPNFLENETPITISS